MFLGSKREDRTSGLNSVCRNSFRHAVFICWHNVQVFELYHIFREFISHLYVVICPAFCSWDVITLCFIKIMYEWGVFNTCWSCEMKVIHWL
jgi:hypothetical protein